MILEELIILVCWVAFLRVPVFVVVLFFGMFILVMMFLVMMLLFGMLFLVMMLLTTVAVVVMARRLTFQFNISVNRKATFRSVAKF